jgi:NADPH-dependent glutamate synthase beta subunit-like oxidoreductase
MVKFFGNVWVGQKEQKPGAVHISLADLQERYSGVILAYGAVAHRDLNIDGEFSIKNVFSSK